MIKSLLIIAVVVAGGFILAVTVGGGTPRGAETTAVESQAMTSGGAPRVGINPGDQAPDFSLLAFDGRTVSIADLRGKPVFVDFWAGWCPFCVGELPEIEAVFQEFADDGLVVLGVHRSETEDVEIGASFARDRGVTYPLLQDRDGAVYRTYSGGRTFMPIAYVIDKNGIIQERMLGPKTAEKIRFSIQKVIGAAE